MRHARIALAVSLTAGALSCASDGDSALSSKIADQVKGGDGVVLRLAEVAPFPWSRLHIFGPYLDDSDIEKDLGFAWPEGRRVGLKMRDDVALLVFVLDGSVEDYVAHRRGYGDFAGLRRVGGYSRDDAVFRVQSDHGWLRFVPAAAAQR